MAKAHKRKTIYSAQDGDLGKVLLFGHEVANVFSCCPSEGWLDMHVTDIDGRCVFPSKDDGPLSIRIHGDVQYLKGGVK